ncbi:MAG: TonB-dependent receptor, partial [Acidobacteria bacterium]|nr:TonB-dependent receptor [Acidobacteriota bacterium]
SLVGEFRLGYNRFKQIRTQLTLEDIPARWGITGTTKSPNKRDYGYPAIRVTGFDPIGKGSLPSDRIDPIYQIIGTVTYTKGNHTLKFGGDANQYGSMRLNNGGGVGDFRFTGEYTGHGMADLLLGYPRRTSRSLGDTRNPLWSESFALFLQDDWKVTPRLTLNLGVRYDLQTPNRSTHDRLVRFNPDTGNIEIAGNASPRRDIGRVDNPLSPHYNAELAQLAARIPMVDLGRRNHYFFDRNDIAPRLGLAYRVLGNDQLVLRTGYGVYFQQLLGQYGHAGWNSFPFFISQVFNASLPQPNISMDNPFPVAQATASISPASVVEHYRTGYVQHYNLGFQYQPWNDVLIDITYAGSASRKLSESRNLNQPRPSPTGSVASRRPYPAFGNISFLDSVSSANFNSLQLRVEKRYSAGLTLGTAYTWSKSLDTTGSGDGDSGSPDSRNVRGMMYGLSVFDVRHRLVVSYVYDLPFGTGKQFLTGLTGFGGWFVSGWEVSGVSTVQSGRPFTVSITADISNTGNNGADRPILIGNPHLPKSERSVDRWFNTAAFAIPARGTQGNVGRNTLIGPPLSNTDFSLIKNNRIGDKENIQFRAEVFNLANHPNLDLPERFVDARTAGNIFTAQFSRQIQLGLKFIF